MPSSHALGKRQRESQSPEQTIAERPAAHIDTTTSDSTSAKTITDLPDELILDIAEIIRVECLDPWKALHSLALTNRQLHGPATEKLYQHYDNSLEPYQFLRALLINSKLGKHVKTLTCHFRYPGECEGGSPGRPVRRYCPSKQDKHMLEVSLKSKGLKNWEDWANSCHKAHGPGNPPYTRVDEDILMTAILMHAPDITEIRCIISNMYQHSTTNWIKLIAGTAPRSTINGSVASLKHLRFVTVDLSGMLGLREIAPLLRIHTLQKLYISNLCEYRNDLLQLLYPQLLSEIQSYKNNIEELSFLGGFVHMDILATIVSSSRQLKSLKMHFHEDRKRLRGTYVYLGKTTLSTALSSQKTSLEEIYLYWTRRIDGATYNFDPSEVDTDVSPWYDFYTSLHEYTSLKRLTAPCRAVFGDMHAVGEMEDARRPTRRIKSQSLELLGLTQVRRLDIRTMGRISTEQAINLPRLRNIVIGARGSSFKEENLIPVRVLSHYMKQTSGIEVTTEPFRVPRLPLWWVSHQPRVDRLFFLVGEDTEDTESDLADEMEDESEDGMWND